MSNAPKEAKGGEETPNSVSALSEDVFTAQTAKNDKGDEETTASLSNHNNNHTREDNPQRQQQQQNEQKEEQDGDDMNMEITIHQMALSRFVSPSWRTKRRRKRSISDCATDLGQRLHQAFQELLESLTLHLQSGNKSTGLTLPVTALAWLWIMLEQDSDATTAINDQTATALLRRLHLDPVTRTQLQQVQTLFQHYITRLRIVSTPWPPITTHRDKAWSLDANNSTQHDNNDDDVALLWLQAFISWQAQPLLTPELATGLLPRLAVLWLDQVPSSCFDRTGIFSTLAPHLQVLRIERTSMEEICCCFDNSIADMLQEPEQVYEQDTHLNGNTREPLAEDPLALPITTNQFAKPRKTRRLIYPCLTHLKITHCQLPTTSDRHRRDPIWRHFPALQSLNLAHNHGLARHSHILTGLSLLTNLQRLDLSQNNLRHSLPWIHLQVGHIEELDLSFNALTTCTPGLDRLYSLKRLHLHHNQLPDLASIRGLARLPELQELSLHENPLAQPPPTTTTKSRKDNNKETTSIQTLASNMNLKDKIGIRNGSVPLSAKKIAKARYRLEVLSLFLEARGQQDMTQPELPVLDHQSVSSTEIEALKAMSFDTQIPSPFYPKPAGSGHYNGHLEGAAGPSLEEMDISRSMPLRRRHVAKIQPSFHKNIRRKSLKKYLGVPSINFNTVDVLQSLPPLIQPDPRTNVNMGEVVTAEAITSNQNNSEKLMIESKALVVTAEENFGASITGEERTEEQEEMVENGTFNLTNDEQPEQDENQVLPSPEIESQSSPIEENVSLLTGNEIDQPDDLPVEQAGNLEGHGSLIESESVIESESINKDSIEELAISPIRPVKTSDEPKSFTRTVTLHNGSPQREQDISAISGGDSTVGEGSTAPLGEIPTEKSALNSAMMLSFAATDQSWRDDASSIVGSIATTSQPDERRKYMMAEKNSMFTGPSAYKQITIHDNLEIYFRLFVFATSSGILSSSAMLSDPEEAAWQHILEIYPRIQLWPVDRKLQEQTALSNSGPTGQSSQENFCRVWRERVVGCGKPALKRLTPTRTARLGFHGEFVFPPSSTLSTAIGSTPNKGRPETVTRERKVILCSSSHAFYVIVDYDASLKVPPNQKRQRSFPRPIPNDACFAEALWPHAMVRHPWSNLCSITIGFDFQRLTLRFSSDGQEPITSRNPFDDEFCYILLTCNKLETVELLKEFQDLTDNIAVAIDAPTRHSNVSIENDDLAVLDGLAGVLQDSHLGVIYHFQILHQHWKKHDRGIVRRLCVVTDTKIYLFDEDYGGDGSKVEETAGHRNMSWGKPEYHKVDSAELSQVESVQAANSDPCSLTISIRPSSRLSRTHNWRLICHDREGAERLLDDVRKAIASATV